ncbi:transketolase C-terminal domain-containing protein [Roseicyclus sp. F158]|uniref:Transketolase C-terminal domain-containing protein n=1 Tax=Tropicimonas omnivorans TaxID=3075590 RepID=A0ABU3DJF3_9RHOB|nr:transketolase C-terminal domain-containing protein [Roseicyclus sp. F158]MDT0683844.1 transketolase C-terminal domain-containing protein [Roseicyclus sp. F158]
MADTLTATARDCRVAWSETLEALAREDDRIVAVVNDSIGSSKLNAFATAFPERTVNVGIAEQLMVGVGAGLANGGKVPFVSAAGCFLTGRALEQIKADVAYSGYNVKLVGQSSGIAYGELGATHHSIEDLGWLRQLGQITVIVPADSWETEQAVRWAAAHDGPVYLRISRMKVPDLDIPDRRFRPGVAEVVREGDDAAILACGTTVHLARDASVLLAEEGIRARVLNMSSVNPLDTEATLSAARTGHIVTVEEGHVRGGLGGAVAEFTASAHPCRVTRMGFDGFRTTGSAEHLFEEAGLSAQGIAGSVRASLSA